MRVPDVRQDLSNQPGRGQHHRLAPRSLERRPRIIATANTNQSKPRWDKEELALMARREAEMTVGNVRYINKALAEEFHIRSLEAIKGQRKVAGYKAEVWQVLPAKQFHQRVRRDFNIQASAGRISNKKKRRRDYAITQRHWKSSRTRCARAILDDTCDAIQQPLRQRMEEYWSTVFTQPPVNTSPSVLHFQAPLLDLWAPITPNEIRAARPSLSVSPGPDGLTSRQLRAIPLVIMVRILHLILLCERLPRDFTLARTIFIPKKTGAQDPGEFRPITVTSSLTRLFHRILAIRADSLLNFDDSQRAFRSGIDGCRDNTMLLDAILRSRYERFKSASIATLDLAKAFDSVEHSAIMKCGAAAGLPPPMIRYLQRFYEDGTTTLTGDQWTSLPIRPTRGVKQGDPLSPVLFNIVIYHLLRSLPTECGIPFCGRTIRAMAFADDLILLAQTPAGLQKLLDHTASFLAECGLRVNSSKCHSLTIRGLGQAKKTVVSAQQHYCVNGQQIRALTSEDTWTYLGIVFSAQGRRKFDSASKISLLLERLAKAPLKPQQRLYALKCYALPRTYHAMSLGNTTISDLNRVDIMTRAFVRQWLALPIDTPTAYFHAPVAEGGLGIPSTRWMAPSLRLSRLRGWLSQPESGTANDITSGTSVDFSSVFVKREIAICEKRLTDGRTILQNTDIIGKRWARLLHSSIEGRALKDSCYTIGQHSWVSDGTALLSSKDYIACHRVRIGALPTRSRLTRGRHGDRQCRAGCRAQETNNHVLQICPRAHAARIKRHDAVANFISRSLTRQGFEVRSKPRISTSIGVRKPDLVATMGDLAVVLDVQIAGDQVDLDYVRHEKIRKYSTLPEVSRYITQETGATNIRHLPVIHSWRGVWGRRSSLDLLALGTVNRRDLTIISTRTLIVTRMNGLTRFPLSLSTSHSALHVLAGKMPMDLKLKQRAAEYRIRKGASVSVEGLDMTSEEVCADRVSASERVRRRLLEIWQAEWNRCEKGKDTYAFFPNIARRLSYNLELDHYVTQLLTGHGNFAYYKFIHCKASSHLCACGVTETSDHVLFDCPRRRTQRRALVEAAEAETGTWPCAKECLVSNKVLFDELKKFAKKALSSRSSNTTRGERRREPRRGNRRRRAEEESQRQTPPSVMPTTPPVETRQQRRARSATDL
ncbi:unnamed protein product [Trichogramma brassicae]|uniref:Reverse transcriptase domain-containing protein n=1 Tax=Trichogramma brassicae TaxID=86971 RepID=A0A6H5J4H1_9HYME|nr:unnamed protein product [Trichogramma brassicae]